MAAQGWGYLAIWRGTIGEASVDFQGRLLVRSIRLFLGSALVVEITIASVAILCLLQPHCLGGESK